GRSRGSGQLDSVRAVRDPLHELDGPGGPRGPLGTRGHCVGEHLPGPGPDRPFRRGGHLGNRPRGRRLRAGLLLRPEDASDPRRLRAVRHLDIGAAIAAQSEWMEELLVALVQAETVLGAEEAGQVLMADAFAACGLEPRDVWLDAPALRADPGSSPFGWDPAGKRCVVARWPAAGSGGRSLILNGHVDVVPPAAAELWTSPPFSPRREGDWLYGRGAGDMKAGLVAIVGAVRALREARVKLRADVHLQSVVEEECTGNGALMCLLDGVR